MNWTPDTLINRERFEAWLATQPMERSFIYASCNACVLASFINETTNADAIIGPANLSLWNVYKHEQDIDIPNWSIQLLDSLRFSPGYIGKITISDLCCAYQKLFGVNVREEIQMPAVRATDAVKA